MNDQTHTEAEPNPADPTPRFTTHASLNQLVELATQRPFTGLLPRCALQAQCEVMLLGITLMQGLHPAQRQAWAQRLQVHLAERGLVAAVAPARIAVMPVGRALADTDRGSVLGWLVAQPEVVFVHIERRERAQRRVSIGCAAMVEQVRVLPALDE